MIRVTDRVKEMIEPGIEVPLNLGKLIIKTDSPISLDLIDWKKRGLRIGVSVKGIGGGYFNKQPYSDRETALREYQHVLAQVQNGNYSLELYGNNKLKLLLTDSE